MDPVSNLTLTRSGDALSQLMYHYTWEAPFSLNITAIESDIAYYVHIYTITCPDQGTRIVNVCNVTVPSYTIQAKSNELYKIEVRPRIYSLTDGPGACSLSRASTAAVEYYEGLYISANLPQV